MRAALGDDDGPVFRPSACDGTNPPLFEFKHRGEINAMQCASPHALLSASSTVRVWDSSSTPRSGSAVHYALGSTMSGGSRFGRAITSVMRGRVSALRANSGVTALACAAGEKRAGKSVYAACGTSEGAVHTVTVDTAAVGGEECASVQGPPVVSVRELSTSAVVSIVVEGTGADSIAPISSPVWVVTDDGRVLRFSSFSSLAGLEGSPQRAPVATGSVPGRPTDAACAGGNTATPLLYVALRQVIEVLDAQAVAVRRIECDGALVSCLVTAAVPICIISGSGSHTHTGQVWSAHADGVLRLWPATDDASATGRQSVVMADAAAAGGGDAGTNNSHANNQHQQDQTHKSTGAKDRLGALHALAVGPCASDVRCMLDIDGMLWLGCGDGRIRTVGSGTGLLREWRAHQSAVTTLAASPPPQCGNDGGDPTITTSGEPERYVASSSKAGTIRLWDAMLRDGWTADRLAERESEYAERVPHRVALLTWNLNAKPPGESLAAWLDGPETDAGASGENGDTPPDLIAIGFQEIVPLNASSVLAGDTGVVRQWEKAIEDGFEDVRKRRAATPGATPWPGYKRIISKQLVGIALVMYTRVEHVQRLSDLHYSITKTGFKGMAGNKGGISVSFRFFDSLLSFTNVHLAAGHSAVEARNADKRTIVAGTTYPRPPGRGHDLLDTDASWFIGDLNYRIDLSREQLMPLADRLAWPELIAHDQLSKQRNVSDAWDDFDEAKINFPPTYKYDVGTDDWDTSAKQRCPAWCDRVLQRGEAITKVLRYGSSPSLRSSDHKPVAALHLISTRVVDESRLATSAARVQTLWSTQWRNHTGAELAALRARGPASRADAAAALEGAMDGGGGSGIEPGAVSVTDADLDDAKLISFDSPARGHVGGDNDDDDDDDTNDDDDDDTNDGGGDSGAAGGFAGEHGAAGVVVANLLNLSLGGGDGGGGGGDTGAPANDGNAAILDDLLGLGSAQPAATANKPLPPVPTLDAKSEQPQQQQQQQQQGDSANLIDF